MMFKFVRGYKCLMMSEDVFMSEDIGMPEAIGP